MACTPGGDKTERSIWCCTMDFKPPRTMRVCMWPFERSAVFGSTMWRDQLTIDYGGFVSAAITSPVTTANAKKIRKTDRRARAQLAAVPRAAGATRGPCVLQGNERLSSPTTHHLTNSSTTA